MRTVHVPTGNDYHTRMEPGETHDDPPGVRLSFTCSECGRHLNVAEGFDIQLPDDLTGLFDHSATSADLNRRYAAQKAAKLKGLMEAATPYEGSVKECQVRIWPTGSWSGARCSNRPKWVIQHASGPMAVCAVHVKKGPGELARYVDERHGHSADEPVA